MNFYPFHIGDYISHTNHLSDAEDLAYRRMIDLYYQSEQPFYDSLTVARRIRATVEVVEIILHEFFDFEDDGAWHNKRIDEEIAKYHDRLTQASKAGKASAEARFNKRSTSVQPTKNQEPLTKNQDNKKATSVACPPDVNEQIWNDWLQLRKSKKASVTQTVINGARKEAEKADLTLEGFLEIWCLRGSQGLEASWIKPEEKAGKQFFKSPANDKSWMFSNEGIVAKANELGVRSEGLSYQQLKEKCVFVMTQRQLQ